MWAGDLGGWLLRAAGCAVGAKPLRAPQIATIDRSRRHARAKQRDEREARA
jgi:hypothetical protein